MSIANLVRLYSKSCTHTSMCCCSRASIRHSTSCERSAEAANLLGKHTSTSSVLHKALLPVLSLVQPASQLLCTIRCSSRESGTAGARVRLRSPTCHSEQRYMRLRYGMVFVCWWVASMYGRTLRILLAQGFLLLNSHPPPFLTAHKQTGTLSVDFEKLHAVKGCLSRRQHSSDIAGGVAITCVSASTVKSFQVPWKHLL